MSSTNFETEKSGELAVRVMCMLGDAPVFASQRVRVSLQLQ